ncbi:MAG: hypothetical protein AB1430_17335 [Pseudomonadota bacterium]
MREGEEAKRVRTARAVTEAQLDFETAQMEIEDRLRSGDLRREELQREWEHKASEIRERAREQVPRELWEPAQTALGAKGRNALLKLMGTAKVLEREETRANVEQTLANLARSADTPRENSVAIARQLLEINGAAAGLGRDDQQRVLQRFRESLAENEAKRLLVSARGNPKALEAVTGRLGTPEFADLNPDARLRLEQYAQQQSESAITRARIEQDRREQQVYGTALLQVETSGTIDPDIWQQLTDGHRASLLNRAKAEAKQRRMEAEGRPVKTDWSLYLTLREQAVADPEKFVQVDLKQYVDRIGGAQLEQLADLKAAHFKAKAAANGKPQREVVSLTQQMNATMQALNIKKPEQKGKFISYVQAEVDAATDAKGKPLTFEERQAIIDRAVLKGPDPDRILPWGERRMFQLTPEQRSRFQPDAPTDAPAAEVEALNEALKAQGLALTPANRLALYRRVMGAKQ